MISHGKQQALWDEEHKNPSILRQMDSRDVSSGVEKFWQFLEETGVPRTRGLEMGCGKGRNVIGLAKLGAEMHGFDFSPSAIEEAKKRADEAGVHAQFVVQDAMRPWGYQSNSFDFAIDCFASTDIESPEGRVFAVSEFRRVLKPGGHLLAYLLSTDDEFHKEMIVKSPADEKSAFFHGNGKFEKVFDETELREMYKEFELSRMERLEKTTMFNGKSYACKHFWLVLKKR